MHGLLLVEVERWDGRGVKYGWRVRGDDVVVFLYDWAAYHFSSARRVFPMGDVYQTHSPKVALSSPLS